MNIVKSLISIYFNLLVRIFPSLAGKQGFYFFCIPFKAKLKPKQLEFLDTAEKHSLLVDDKKIQTYVWGSGPKVLLFIHGWQSNSYRWRNYIERLDHSKHKLIAFDAPGHGSSEGLYSNVPLFEKAINAVISRYGSPNSIIAHSIGSFSSFYYLHKTKTDIEKIVSLAPPFSAEQFVSVYQSELKLSARVIQVLRAYFNSYTGHPVEYYSLKNFAPSVKTKALLIHDHKDESTSYQNSEKLHSLLSTSELYLTEGLGHRLRGDAVVERVVEFVG